MTQHQSNFICMAFGHDIHMRIHPTRVETTKLLQVICKRCMKNFGQREAFQFEPPHKTEEWLIKVIPERNKKRLYKKVKELYG